MKYQPIKAEGRPHTAPVPSSRYAYNHYKCRCDECRDANRLVQRATVADLRARLADEFDNLPHGDVSTYDNWGCRCVPCAEAKSIKNASDYALRKYGATI